MSTVITDAEFAELLSEKVKKSDPEFQYLVFNRVIPSKYFLPK